VLLARTLSLENYLGNSNRLVRVDGGGGGGGNGDDDAGAGDVLEPRESGKQGREGSGGMHETWAVYVWSQQRQHREAAGDLSKKCTVTTR
jgi:hypothetical protein